MNLLRACWALARSLWWRFVLWVGPLDELLTGVPWPNELDARWFYYIAKAEYDDFITNG